MARNAQIDHASFEIGGAAVPLGHPVADIKGLLGLWDRVYEGSMRAPLGYRNNIRYIYDAVGVSVLDEWTDETLKEVIFHLVHEPKVPYSPLNVWDGELFICGHRVGAEQFWRMVDGTDEIAFSRVVGGAYSMELGPYYLSIDVSRPPRRRSKSGRSVLSVSVSLLRKNQKRGAPAE